MRTWLSCALLALLCMAGAFGLDAQAQGMRGPPPLPPPGMPPPPPPGDGTMPPPPPPQGQVQVSDGNQQTGQPAQIQAQVQVQQQQTQQSNPAWPTQQTPAQSQQPANASSSPAVVVPVASPAAPDTSDAQQPLAAPPHVTIDPDAAKWAAESKIPTPIKTAPKPPPPPSNIAPIDRIVELIPRWVWFVVIALPLLLLALTFAMRRMVGLEIEKQKLARHQRVLEAEQRNLRDESQNLRHQATNDPLTGILNRRAFADEMRKLLDHLSKFGRPLDLIVFDLDHFKQINDQQGHLAGDIALKLVAGIVHRHLKSDDLFGRFGGDEFLIACADRSPEATEQLANTIRRAVVAESATCKPPLPGLSLSMGVARATRDSGYQVEALFARADTALYAAKRGGRNRVVVANDDLPRPPAEETVTRQLA